MCNYLCVIETIMVLNWLVKEDDTIAAAAAAAGEQCKLLNASKTNPRRKMCTKYLVQ